MKIEWGVKSRGSDLIINNPIKLSGYRYFYIDCETDEKDHITSIALCPKEGVVYWFPWPTKHESAVKQAIESSWLAGHNIKGDMHWLRAHGFNVDINKVVFDTQLAAYVICSTSPSLSLKKLVHNILDWDYPSYKEITKGKEFKKYAGEYKPSVLIPSKAKRKPGKAPKMLLPHQILLKDNPVDVVSNYNGMDSLSGEVLGEVYKGVLTGEQQRYLEKLEMPAMRVCYEMEKKGIKVNLPLLQEYHQEWQIKHKCAEDTLYTMAGKQFNPNSPKQKLQLLKKIVDRNLQSTGRPVLKPFAANQFVQALWEYSDLQRLISTYSGPLILKTLQDSSHRIHTSFNQVATDSKGNERGIRTGRLSSSKPNLQNIHAEEEDDDGNIIVHPLRYVFIPKVGSKFAGADYSQIEYRYLAHESEDPTLLNAYEYGLDVHAATAAKVFGLDIDQVSSSQRRAAKTINFGVIYGAGPQLLSEMLEWSLPEAQRFLKTYKAQFPMVEDWKRRALNDAHLKGGVRTLFGRFIPLPDLRSIDPKVSSKAERQAINYIIQGSSADILKTAMIRLHKKHGIVPVLNVHDEIILEAPEAKAEEQAKILEYEMSNVAHLKVSLKVNAKIGNNWAEVK